jgi:hypothetical protein
MKANVLQQEHIARYARPNGADDLPADAVAKLAHRAAEELCNADTHGIQTQFRDGDAVRAAEVRHENDGRSAVQKQFERRYGGPDAGVVLDRRPFEGNVVVDADEDHLPGYICILDPS